MTWKMEDAVEMQEPGDAGCVGARAVEDEDGDVEGVGEGGRC